MTRSYEAMPLLLTLAPIKIFILRGIFDVFLIAVRFGQATKSAFSLSTGMILDEYEEFIGGLQINRFVSNASFLVNGGEKIIAE